MYETSLDGETIYTFLDTSKPVDQMVRQTTEAPSGDGKTTEPYYLDTSAFIEKMSDVNKDSLS
jgi:hypothetical protein